MTCRPTRKWNGPFRVGKRVEQIYQDTIQTEDDMDTDFEWLAANLPWWEDYQKNEQELRSQGLLMDPYSPHYVDNPHYKDNPHYQKPLDSSFKPVV